MALPAIPILTGIIQLGQTWLESRAKRKEAITDAEVQVIKQASQSAADWEAYMAKASESSWKDEFWTVILAAPCILAFFPGMVPYIDAGFAALSEMPEYYKGFVGASIAASFGLHHLSKWRGK